MHYEIPNPTTKVLKFHLIEISLPESYKKRMDQIISKKGLAVITKLSPLTLFAKKMRQKITLSKISCLISKSNGCSLSLEAAKSEHYGIQKRNLL